jgi:hypothetical protein
MAGFPLSTLLGLPLQEAQDRMNAAGLSAPRVVRSLPARTRHALPEVVDWRVARARWDGDTPELVAVPAVPLP